MANGHNRQRTISYLRAQWAVPPDTSLELALKTCLMSFPDREDTRLPLRDMHAEVRHRRLTRRRVYLHVAAWTEGEPASIVPHGVLGNEADLDQSVPDDAWDYLDGDGMIFVSENHCLLMPSGLRSQTLELYLRSLLERGRDEYDAQIPEHIESFELVPVADERVVQQIRRQGVKRIGLNLGQYLETARQHDDGRSTIVQRIGAAILENLVLRPEDRQRIEAAENVHAKLVITCDTRRAGIAPEDLIAVAANIADESEDDVEIETGTGQRIKRGQVLLKKTVAVAAFAKTVHHGDAWDHMREYFGELRDGGMLEE